MTTTARESRTEISAAADLVDEGAGRCGGDRHVRRIAVEPVAAGLRHATGAASFTAQTCRC
jgi:hypothetical protein